MDSNNSLPRFDSACLLAKLPWPGDSEVTFRSSSEVATCLPTTFGWNLYTPFNAKRQGKEP